MANLACVPRSAPFGVLAVAVASVLFAVNGTVAKLAMQAGLSPTRLVELRSVGSAVVLVTIALLTIRRQLRLRANEILVMAVLGIVGMALVQWFYLVAISRLPVGLAAAGGAALSLATYYLLGERLVAWVVVLGTVVPYTLVLSGLK